MKVENIQTKERFGIKLPNDELKVLLFSNKKGLVTEYGVVGSNTHVTLIDEGDSVSSHLTDQTINSQDNRRWKHLGKLSTSEINEQVVLDQLKPRLIGNEELDKKVTYLTNKWNNVFNPLETDFMKKIITAKKTTSYLDLEALIHPIQNLIPQLASQHSAFYGSCTAREALARDEIELCLLNNGRFLIKVDDELHEMDILSLLGANGLIFQVFDKLGFNAINGDIMKRLQGISSKQSVNCR